MVLNNNVWPKWVSALILYWVPKPKLPNLIILLSQIFDTNSSASFIEAVRDVFLSSIASAAKLLLIFPKLFVEYSREYLIMNDVRISIDQNIQYKDCLTNNIFNDNKIIVELKTSINKNLDELTSDFPMQRVRFSKYCYAIESLNNFTKQSI